jgi:RsiW-degrading membrane proteinase PrsW (M82 family)
MERTSAVAFGMILAAMGIAVWAVLVPGDASSTFLVLGAVAAPIGVLLAVRRRVGPTGAEARAALGGAIVGPVVALASHAFVGAFATAFFLGFADAGRDLLEAFRVDPRLRDLLASPWVVLVMVDLAVVAPLTEEAGKALGAFWFGRPTTRREAFLAGAAAGTGFAVIENLLYAAFTGAFGGPWQAVVLARTVGSAVHPLASGLVALGVHDREAGGGAASLLRGYGAAWGSTPCGTDRSSSSRSRRRRRAPRGPPAWSSWRSRRRWARRSARCSGSAPEGSAKRRPRRHGPSRR